MLAGLTARGAREAGSLALPAETHVASLLLGLALLALAQRVWRGTRAALALAIGALISLAVVSACESRYGEATVQACLAVMLAMARGAFLLGCSHRPRLAVVGGAIVAWGLAGATILAARLARGGPVHIIARVLRHPAIHTLRPPRPDGSWTALIEVLIAAAAVISALALRSLVRPAAAVDGHDERQHREARAIVDAYGSDSLSPFLLRPDKALAFAAGGVLSYQVIGGTAIVSADPVAPAGAAGEVLACFREQARGSGWQVVVWGAGARHIDAYRKLGLHAVCVGEEAFVDPATFNLEGRPVRKLRQSVNRVQRRGWEVMVHEGRDIDGDLEAEILALHDQWRASHPRVRGFAMGMGAFAGELRADDLYLLGRSPSGALGAVMRFVSCGAGLSLDTMQRVGETPNGLNEALVAAALEAARKRGVTEVSLNYAGLAHLVRRAPGRSRAGRLVGRLALAPLHRRFQMDRLVCFNDKFGPEWRPRYLVYESRTALPGATVRALQAEGYLPCPGRAGLRFGATPNRPRARPARLRPPVGESR